MTKKMIRVLREDQGYPHLCQQKAIFKNAFARMRHHRSCPNKYAVSVRGQLDDAHKRMATWVEASTCDFAYLAAA
jgi:hypothetical protein